MQTRSAVAALQEAYNAASCVRCLLIHVENVPDSQRHFTRTELKALHAVIDSEVERRFRIVRTAMGPAPVQARPPKPELGDSQAQATRANAP